MPDTTGPPTFVEIRSWLQAQWEEVTQVSGIGLDDNFFEVGGNSMHMVDVHSRIVDELDLPELSLVDLFEYTTLRSLANHLRDTIAARSSTPAFCQWGIPTLSRV